MRTIKEATGGCVHELFKWGTIGSLVTVAGLTLYTLASEDRPPENTLYSQPPIAEPVMPTEMPPPEPAQSPECELPVYSYSDIVAYMRQNNLNSVEVIYANGQTMIIEECSFGPGMDNCIARPPSFKRLKAINKCAIIQ